MYGIPKRDKLLSCVRRLRGGGGGRKRIWNCEDRVYLKAAAKDLENEENKSYNINFKR